MIEFDPTLLVDARITPDKTDCSFHHYLQDVMLQRFNFNSELSIMRDSSETTEYYEQRIKDLAHVVKDMQESLREDKKHGSGIPIYSDEDYELNRSNNYFNCKVSDIKKYFTSIEIIDEEQQDFILFSIRQGHGAFYMTLQQNISSLFQSYFTESSFVIPDKIKFEFPQAKANNLVSIKITSELSIEEITYEDRRPKKKKLPLGECS